jgi:hypothetical protein
MFGNLSDRYVRQAVGNAGRNRDFLQIYLTGQGMKERVNVPCGKVRVTDPDDGALPFHRTENGQPLIGLQDELQVYQIMPGYTEISRQ